MNRKQFIFLLVLVVVIGGAAWWHYRQQTAAWSNAGSAAAGQKLLGNFQINDVAAIVIQQGTNVLRLAKNDEIWGVTQRHGYPADFSKISQLLIKLQGLKIIQTEPVTASQLPQLDLAAPGPETNSATLLAFYDDAGKPLRTLWLGREHMHDAGAAADDESWPDGRYVLTDSNATTVAVLSDPLTEVDPQPQAWLDKTFFQIADPKSIAVDFSDATNSWKLTRASVTNSWELADAKPDEHLDDSQASETADSFSSPSFSDVLNPQDGDWQDSTRVQVNTFDGFQYALTIGAKTNDDNYLKVKTSFTYPQPRKPGKNETAAQKAALDKAYADKVAKLKEKFHQESLFGNWTYLVPDWTVEPLLKVRSQLLVIKPETTATNTPVAKSKL